MAPDDALSGRVVLVTGGTSGVGRAVALRLARAGADVAVHGGEGVDAELVANEAHHLGVRAVAVMGDVVEPGACDDIVASVRDRLGPVDVLVHCVGIRPHQAVVDMSVDEWRRVIDTNCSSFFYLSKLLLPSMIDRGFGRLVAVSVAVGDRARIRHASVAAARSALSELVKCIAVENGPSGVTANIVSQAIDETAQPAVLATEVLEELLAIPRPALLDEIAAACAYLVSPSGAYITGHTLHVDGGYTI